MDVAQVWVNQNKSCVPWIFTVVLCVSKLIFIIAYLLFVANWVCRLHLTPLSGAKCTFSWYHSSLLGLVLKKTRENDLRWLNGLWRTFYQPFTFMKVKILSCGNSRWLLFLSTIVLIYWKWLKIEFLLYLIPLESFCQEILGLMNKNKGIN